MTGRQRRARDARWQPIVEPGQRRRPDPVADHRLITVTAAALDPAPEDVRQALALFEPVRRELDRLERVLISTAREQRLSWPAIADALGLGSRQAAEQRWLRLLGDASRDPTGARRQRREQRIVDDQSGPELAELRKAAAGAYRRIEADRDWDERHARAALARISLAEAAAAPPGALYALCRNVIDDLDAMAAVPLPAALMPAVRRLRRAVREATATPRTT